MPFLAINIDIDPTMFDLGPLTLTWHGFFTAVGIIAGVWLAVALCKRDGIPTEIAQEIALVGVPSAIVGARLFYVFEHWDKFSGDIPRIVTGLTEGGITLYGGLLGGVLGGLVYSLVKKLPIAITLDAAAPGMLLGQALGRVGDLINGEHWADASSLPWAFRYTNPNTLGEIGKAVQPTAGGYELVGDVIILGLLLFVFRRIFRTPGWLFCTYMVLYGALRFVLSFTRTNEQVIGSVPVPQLVSGIIVGAALVLASILMRWPGPITPEFVARIRRQHPEAGEPPSATPDTAIF